MALTRRIARPLLASAFVVGGLDAVRHPSDKAKDGSVMTEALNGRVPATGKLDAETLVRINGGAQIVAGLLLAAGRFRRLASLVLIGTIVPTTYAGHRFWEETDEAIRTQQRLHFVKNLGLLGGLILAALDTEGKPSLSWRAKRRIRELEVGRDHKYARSHSTDLGTASKAVIAAVPAVIGTAAEGGSRTVRRTRRSGRQASRQVKVTGLDVARKAAEAGAGIRDAAGEVGQTLRGSSDGAGQALQQTGALLAGAARELEPELAAHASDTLANVRDRLPFS
jgi:uncharacterized membrane protein YphA (DoxX/SURF4 family)